LRWTKNNKSKISSRINIMMNKMMIIMISSAITRISIQTIKKC